jgi:hypothetical protein
MKKLIICISMMIAFSLVTNAQSVNRQGNTFTQVTNKKSTSKETKTQYTYKDSKGVVYPIYLSSTGKAFIKKVSKKTGKEYKQYLPEIGKQINPQAYKEKK